MEWNALSSPHATRIFLRAAPLGFGLCFGCSIRGGGHYLSTLPVPSFASQQAAACHASGRSVGPLIPFIPHKTPSLWRRNRPIARSLGVSPPSERGSPLPRLGTSRAASPIEGRRMICFPEGKFAFTRNLESTFLIRSVVFECRLST